MPVSRLDTTRYNSAKMSEPSHNAAGDPGAAGDPDGSATGMESSQQQPVSCRARLAGESDGEPSIDRQVAQAQDELKDESKSLAQLASLLAPLAKDKPYADLHKLPTLIDEVGEKITALPHGADRGAKILAGVRTAVADRRRYLRENLARELLAACESRGLSLRVVRKEEPVEVRIPPFAVMIDRDKGNAELRFARLPLASCAADAPAIVALHEKTRASLDADFDAERFFDACHKAWLAGRGAGEVGAGDRIEILDFLPYLAMQLQTKAFRVEPSTRNYRGYGRARFAYDMLRLRRAGGLAGSEWRINLGVATGTTASKKNRVIWFEDEQGDGEFKLTVFFTRRGDRA